METTFPQNSVGDERLTTSFPPTFHATDYYACGLWPTKQTHTRLRSRFRIKGCLIGCYITATLLVVLIRFLYFCNFPNYSFFSKRQEVFLSNPSQTDRLELADMRKSEFKANFILKHDLPELSGALHMPEGFCYSQRQKEVKGHLQNKRETNIATGCFAKLESLAFSSTLFHRLYNWQKTNGFGY